MLRSFAVGGVGVEEPLVARPLSTGVVFPLRSYALIYDLDDTSIEIRLDFQVIDEEHLVGGKDTSTRTRPVLVAFSVRTNGQPRELSATELDALPIDRLVDIGVRAVAMSFESGAPGTRFGADVSGAGIRAARSRRHLMTDDLLREVAKIVNDPNSGNAPTRSVQEQMFVSYRTAARWVAESRERGFLPPVATGGAARKGKKK